MACGGPLQVNAVDGTGQTALHWAGVRGSLSVAETLLRAGAALGAKDCRGYTVCTQNATQFELGSLSQGQQRAVGTNRID